MSKQHWAAIVYGRSYHLDFRFITIPHNFTERDVGWASQHILATTYQARNLSDHPRWSLFKNNLYCVAGVTCMVRDLIGQMDEDAIEVKAKDDQGRPLYVFLGYVTPLNQKPTLLDFPAYTGDQLASFEPLYQEIEKVWLIKDYEPNSKEPLLSEYQPVNFFINLDKTAHPFKINDTYQLNHQDKHPDKIFLWSSSSEQNSQLWLASAQCSQATSVCLNIKDKSLPNSPFLNQSVSQLEQFTIKERIATSEQSYSESAKSSNFNFNSSLPQKISARAREDLNLTFQQAAKLTAASQELISNLSDRSDKADKEHSEVQDHEIESFGFKTKKSSSTNKTKNEDWF